MQKIYYDFTGGISDVSPEQIAENELEYAMNVEVSRRGGLKKRRGTVKLNPVSYGAQIERLIEWVKKDGLTILLAVIAGQLCRINPDGSKIDLHPVSSSRLAYIIVQDKFYFIDNNEFYVYDGDKVSLARPVIEIVNISGVFQVGEQIEGNTSGATAYIDQIDAGKLGVSQVVGIFEQDETITGKITGATAKISYIDPSVDERNNLSNIKKCKYIVRHPKSFRLFFCGNPDDVSAVYFSEPNDPTFVMETSVVYPTANEGSAMGFKVLMDALIVFYRYGAWVWRGVDPTYDAIWEKLPTSQGTLSEETIQLTTDSLTSLAPGGLFIMTPSIIGVPMNLEAGRNFIQNVTQNKVSSIIKRITHYDRTSAVYDSANEVYMLAYCDDDCGWNNKVLIFDFKTGGFWQYDLKVNNFCRCINGDILIASENYILKLSEQVDSDIHPDGLEYPIDFSILTKRYSLDVLFANKRLERVYVSFKNLGALHEIDAELIVDGQIKKQFMITGEDSSAGLVVHKEKVSVVGNRFQLRLRNTQLSDIEIYGIGFDYDVVQRVGDKV